MHHLTIRIRSIVSPVKGSEGPVSWCSVLWRCVDPAWTQRGPDSDQSFCCTPMPPRALGLQPKPSLSGARCPRFALISCEPAAVGERNTIVRWDLLSCGDMVILSRISQRRSSREAAEDAFTHAELRNPESAHGCDLWHTFYRKRTRCFMAQTINIVSG